MIILSVSNIDYFKYTHQLKCETTTKGLEDHVHFKLFFAPGARFDGKGYRSVSRIVDSALSWKPDYLVLFPDIVANNLTCPPRRPNAPKSSVQSELSFVSDLSQTCAERGVKVVCGLIHRDSANGDDRDFNSGLKEC